MSDAAQASERPKPTSHIYLLREKLGGPYPSLTPKSTISVLMKHGGFQILIKPGTVLTRLRRHMPERDQHELMDAALEIGNAADNFFQRLSDRHYGIPSELISYLTLPHEGKTYTDPKEKETENPTIPAAFTFVGQFIDHDLTFNGANLFDNQAGPDVQDFATPLIDLDSVYGGRAYPGDPSDPSLKGVITSEDVFNTDMSFKLWRLGPNAYDVRRWEDAKDPGRLGAAYIFDPRNDENQIILQVHILLMRLHNEILPKVYREEKLDPKVRADALKACAVTKERVIANWQSVILHDYLPRVCQADVLKHVRAEIVKPAHGDLKYKPPAEGPLRMPHEFAIAFRFGHSMLRTAYNLNGFGPIQLFNNQDLQRQGDLRGGRPLSRGHVIDWDIFLPKDEFCASPSLKIDSKVTAVVFDLPESTIPDMVKTSSNLPYRNLTRSREIDLACGEDLAEFFGIDPRVRLTRWQVEPEDSAHYLFEADVNIYSHPDGAGAPLSDLSKEGFADTRFKTPLWYYILKEAELLGNGERLGPLGSRLVAEVICGGIFYGTDTKFDSAWKSEITKSNVVKLRDLIDFVDEQKPMMVRSVTNSS
jgi:hypothetical protein